MKSFQFDKITPNIFFFNDEKEIKKGKLLIYEHCIESGSNESLKNVLGVEERKIKIRSKKVDGKETKEEERKDWGGFFFFFFFFIEIYLSWLQEVSLIYIVLIQVHINLSSSINSMYNQIWVGEGKMQLIPILRCSLLAQMKVISSRRNKWYFFQKQQLTIQPIYSWII